MKALRMVSEMPKPRQAEVHRETTETGVDMVLSLDPDVSVEFVTARAPDISVSCGFLEHMLRILTFHGQLDLKIHAYGDTEVDCHHLVEDVGICFGQALREALGDKRGIARYGSGLAPMDDALSMVVVDLSGRPYLHFNVPMPCAKAGDFDTELVEEFMRALANHGQLTLHIDLLHGSNTHHIIESVFKSLALALRQAVARDTNVDADTDAGTGANAGSGGKSSGRTARQIPSTKGVL